LGQLGLPVSISQEAVVANALEAIRQHVQQEPPDELVRRQSQRFGLAAVPVILPLKADRV
jgi:energy-coupling factor transporter ATP-binding protein EcfA2